MQMETESHGAAEDGISLLHLFPLRSFAQDVNIIYCLFALLRQCVGCRTESFIFS